MRACPKPRRRSRRSGPRTGPAARKASPRPRLSPFARRCPRTAPTRTSAFGRSRRCPKPARRGDARAAPSGRRSMKQYMRPSAASHAGTPGTLATVCSSSAITSAPLPWYMRFMRSSTARRPSRRRVRRPPARSAAPVREPSRSASALQVAARRRTPAAVKPAFHLCVGCRVCSAIARRRASAASARAKSQSSIANVRLAERAKYSTRRSCTSMTSASARERTQTRFGSVSGAQHA